MTTPDDTTPPTPTHTPQDRAYANKPYIPDAEGFTHHWASAAATFRETHEATLDIPYGVSRREHYDLFHPAGTPEGLAVFIHGGYWMAFDKSTWSHLAAGPLAHGFAVAVPSYPLCPAVRIADITTAAGAAIAHAAGEVAGPIHIAGHSAGGHLASRMACTNTPLPAAVAERVQRVVSISGVHDLRPLLNVALNETLRLDHEEARHESPVLADPLPVDLVTWVGDGERPQFRRQSRILALMWEGLARSSTYVEAPDRHHFDVVEDLTDPASPLTRTLVGL